MHVIRLRGPWNYSATDSAGQTREGRAPLADGVTEVAPPGFIGTVRWRRSFHRPTGLDDGERVFLAIDNLRDATVELNGVALPSERCEITTRLHARNELVITQTCPSASSTRCFSDVRLEIVERNE